jgi:hypothetical protein
MPLIFITRVGEFYDLLMSYPSSCQLKIMSLVRDHGFSALEYQYSAERMSNQNGQLFFKKVSHIQRNSRF